MVKAAVAALKKFPESNASLDGDTLVYKNYWHIGFAADTPNGLMVPVIRDADKKSIPEIANEMNALAKLAREGKIKPDQMQGGTFSISSLGGIGGIYFTPIINAPEVAIMSEARALTNLIGNGVATIVVAKWEGALDERVLHQRLDLDRDVEADEPESVTIADDEKESGAPRPVVA